jgi:hypothetical protein
MFSSPHRGHPVRLRLMREQVYAMPGMMKRQYIRSSTAKYPGVTIFGFATVPHLRQYISRLFPTFHLAHG